MIRGIRIEETPDFNDMTEDKPRFEGLFDDLMDEPALNHLWGHIEFQNTHPE
mgnify:CR=1 FL=1